VADGVRYISLNLQNDVIRQKTGLLGVTQVVFVYLEAFTPRLECLCALRGGLKWDPGSNSHLMGLGI
jgi:hypothetical protein